jgi:hypothetical protein
MNGALVTTHDDGSQPSMYDLRISYRDGRFGAVQVTAAAHPEALALWRHIGGGRWIEPSLRGGWAISLTPTANYKRLKAELPTLLLQLESKGVTDLHISPDSATGFCLDKLGFKSRAQIAGWISSDR